MRNLMLLRRFVPAIFFGTSVFAKSILFEHGTIITLDEATQVPVALHNASLLITDDRVAAILDSSQGDYAIPEGTERVDATNDIISPGFIDTHRHVWQTFQRTLGANSPLAVYLNRFSSGVAAIIDPEIMYYSELVGLCEAINAGVTSIVDNASGAFTEQIADAEIQGAIDSGIRSFFAYPIRRGMPGFEFEDQVRQFQSLLASERVAQSRVAIGLSYEAFDTGSEEDNQFIAELARTSNISVLETHFVGGPMGFENSPTRLSELGILNETFPIIFVHASGLTATDINLLRSTNQYIAMAPEFEMHHGTDNFNPSLVQDQASLSVGTHYSFSGDLVSQARIWLQTVRDRLLTRKLRDFRMPTNNPMSVNQAFLLATRSGGLALRRPDLGVIKVGAKADIAVFDGAAPGLLGWKDPVAAIILQSHVGTVKHVLVDGSWMKRDGQLLCASNQTDVQTRFLESARKVQQYWGETPMPAFEGQAPITGALYDTIDTLDVVRGPLNGY